MSSEASTDRAAASPGPEDPPSEVRTVRLGYLLKHTWLRMVGISDSALAPHGIDGREWAVLLSLAEQEPVSQQQLAHRMGIDRTTMVAMVDALETKGLAQRRPHPDDRRRNVVELTDTGQRTLRAATRAADDAEQRFLSPLSEQEAQQLKDALYRLLSSSAEPGS